MPKAVIFDMDGVLVNSEPVYDAYHQTLAKKLSIAITDKHETKFRGTPSLLIYEAIAEEFGLSVTPEELLEEETDAFRILFAAGDIPAMPHVFDLLRHLKESGFLVGVATSNYLFNVESVLKNNGASGHVDQISTMEFVRSPKPAPDVFLHAAEGLQVDPADCVVFEDSPNGIAAAKAAGMKVIGYANPEQVKLDVSRADRVIQSFDEITAADVTALLERK
ncbi:MAG TPA: HAD family phosphatase [Feifaniaceae bacterium]|nr:HAD family phosphatase [Feifaniaceae bacterium]